MLWSLVPGSRTVVLRGISPGLIDTFMAFAPSILVFYEQLSIVVSDEVSMSGYT